MQTDLDRSGRLSFLVIDEETRQVLREFRTILAPQIDSVLEAFYRHVGANAQMARIFTTSASQAHARAMQRQHWMDNVFSGEFNERYFEQVVKIGKAHERIGLEPRWYLAGYCFTLNRLVALATQTYRKKPERLAQIVSAINKAVFLDMDLAISVYIDATRETAARILNEHASVFEKDIQGMVNIVASAATELESTSQSMSATAEETSRQSTSV
ncbi:MAG: chemotaxis protein, partial [Rhodospirillales bacterium]|nr:chemotaxis protein [Rhodospirillales bacterium]